MPSKLPNPCLCGISLQRGVKTIAIIDIIFETLNVLLVAYIVWILVTSGAGVLGPEDEDQIHLESSISAKTLVLGIIVRVFISFTGLMVAVILLRGVINKNRRECTTWLVANVILLVYNFILIAVTSVEFDIVYNTMDVVVRCYMMWVVAAFIREIDTEIPTSTIDASAEIPVTYAYSQPQPINDDSGAIIITLSKDETTSNSI